MSSSLQAVSGHISLGNFKAATDELCRIRIGHQGTVEALKLWAQLHAAQKSWTNVDVVCRTLRKDYPEESFGYCQGAESLHQQGRTAEAIVLLRQNERGMSEDASILYSMARYECALDNLLGATLLLGTAFRRDESLRDRAFADRDLSKVWASLNESDSVVGSS